MLTQAYLGDPRNDRRRCFEQQRDFLCYSLVVQLQEL